MSQFKMSTINQHFTFHYSQPDEYHFSHDSVFLARYIYELYAQRSVKDLELLDLCAGCGIVGLDLLFHFQKENQQTFLRADFLEVQEIYIPHFKKNSANFPCTHFLNINYDQLHHKSPQYDLIVCNPPYFQTSQGKLSPSQFKNRCRFFIDSHFPQLLNAIKYSLKPTGQAFLLCKNSKDLTHDYLHIEKVHEIRGTGVLKISAI